MMTVTDLYTARGLALKSKGRNSRGAEFAGPCPLCGGRDRFLVWPEQNDGRGSYSCRQCGISGDVIQWLMDVEGMTFRQAAQTAGRAWEKRPVKSAPQEPQKREKAPARLRCTGNTGTGAQRRPVARGSRTFYRIPASGALDADEGPAVPGGARAG